MGQLKSHQRLQKGDTFQKLYKETIDKEVKAGHNLSMLIWPKPEKSFNCTCHLILSSTRKTQRVQRGSKVPKRSPEQQSSIWTRTVAVSDRN